MAYHQPSQVIGFHSCDKEVGIKVLNGELELNPSDNAWDWLGGGVYFWEQNPERAVQYAIECANGQQKNKKRIGTPFVIGSTIELGNCLNLLDPKAMEIVVKAHAVLLETLKNTGESLPVNDGPKRNLDCAVIKMAHEVARHEGLIKYDTVRCAFAEGKAAYAGSNFSMRGHIEVCVINPDMIKGYFLPRPLELFNPYLKKDFIPKAAA
ncbi:MAG TPA: hypothetical protein VL978_01730 [Puia sp.]|nr:hypothetical protein [Puia sp.]